MQHPPRVQSSLTFPLSPTPEPPTPKPRNPETPKPRNPGTPKPRNPETPKPGARRRGSNPTNPETPKRAQVHLDLLSLQATLVQSKAVTWAGRAAHYMAHTSRIEAK